jgi:hypothetical protein
MKECEGSLRGQYENFINKTPYHNDHVNTETNERQALQPLQGRFYFDGNILKLFVHYLLKFKADIGHGPASGTIELPTGF